MATRKKSRSTLEERIARTEKLVKGKRPGDKKKSDVKSRSEKKPVKPVKKTKVPKKRTARKPKTEPEKKKGNDGRPDLKKVQAELDSLKGKGDKKSFLRKLELGRLRKELSGEKK